MLIQCGRTVPLRINSLYLEQKCTCYEASYGYLFSIVVQFVQDLSLHTKHESENSVSASNFN